METTETQTPTRLLVVDDDAELCGLLSKYLGEEGFVVSCVPDGESALALFASQIFELVVLDVGLPGISGVDVLSRIRSKSLVPVVMLTASGDLDYRIRGLEAGADDYIAKPFSTQELVLRLRAVLRRTHAPTRPLPTTLRIDDVVVDFGSHEVRCGGRAAILTSAELEILGVLMERAGAIVSRDELSGLALQRPSSPFDRSLDVHMSRIRRKLGPRADGLPRIKTIRGEGYLFVQPST
jgi:DNA-binding response OmpR family regulator